MSLTSGQNSLRVSVARAIFLLRSGQFRELFSAFTRKLMASDPADDNERYQQWIVMNEPDPAGLMQLRNWSASLEQAPLITIVIKNATDPALVQRTRESIRKQLYEHWEVVVGSDYKNVRGSWIATIAEGDTLAPFALTEVVKAIQDNSDVDLIYSDHDWMNELGVRMEPFFKPEWSPEYAECSPYIGQFAVQNAEGGKQLPRKAVRIPKVLYHYHSRPSYPSSKAGTTSYTGSISILIPTRDQPARLKCAITSIFQKTTYSNFEIIIINNASSGKETLTYLEECARDSRIRIIDYDQPFNFSAINNFVVSKTNSDSIVFLNDDTEVITPHWLEELQLYSCRDQIGAVGAKLLYRNNTIQHAGVLVGLPEIAVHAHRGWPSDSDGYRGRLKAPQNYTAVTAACMIIKRKTFLEVGGFDENLPLAYNDVDLCLKLRERGYRNVWTPYSELFHDESASRGYEATLEKQKRFASEAEYFLKRWKQQLEKGDPYYNPNLTLHDGAFRIRT
jgi:GT2 family glycosyltransferase